MYMSGESLVIILLVGLVAGWLDGQIVQGTGFGLIGDLMIGVIGAFIGGWLLPQLGIQLGSGIVSAIIDATIGALILLTIMRLVRGGTGWRARLQGAGAADGRAASCWGTCVVWAQASWRIACVINNPLQPRRRQQRSCLWFFPSERRTPCLRTLTFCISPRPCW